MGTFGNIQESEQTDFPGQRIQEPRHSHKSRKLSARSCYQSKRAEVFLWFSHLPFAPPPIDLLVSFPPNTTPTQVVLLLYNYTLIRDAILACIFPDIRRDVGSDPAWRRALPEELPPLPVEDSANQLGHIKRAQNRQMSDCRAQTRN
ncbi:unnamed protein product [Penicillium camemberti]|uniref:Str. FM013 n=1 Tax=Penicillium camemberti (strain FM 013) TaxID=1429867 RepID=A0A0G4PE48_PENC3|nr:unnamed protein product [Penicillium camemberti]